MGWIDAKYGSGDDEDDEGKERDTTKAVQWVPVPNNAKLVLLCVRQWHLAVHVVISTFGHVPIVLEAEASVQPREDPQEKPLSEPHLAG